MKKILVLFIVSIQLFGGIFEIPLITVDNNNSSATIKIQKIDVGISGFLIKKITPKHTVIIKNIVVSDFDTKTNIATLCLSDYVNLQNDALPQIKQIANVGDTALLAFGYSRGLLIAPSENIYYKIKKNIQIQWLHPDIFATTLSVNGHPTPLQEDFKEFATTTATGLFFIYIDKKLYTLDAQSFKILNISDAPFIQKDKKLPFYTRIKEIDANWFGEGKEKLVEYDPHYYSLLVKNNKTNKKLFNILKLQNKKYSDLLKQFEIEE
jgi:hypothetical protein